MKANTARARILRVLENAPEGLTCKQIERMTGIRHATASAALTQLANDAKAFRLHGFEPYHWVTHENLRGRMTVGARKTRLWAAEVEIGHLRHEITRAADAFDPSAWMDSAVKMHSILEDALDYPTIVR